MLTVRLAKASSQTVIATFGENAACKFTLFFYISTQKNSIITSYNIFTNKMDSNFTKNTTFVQKFQNSMKAIYTRTI